MKSFLIRGVAAAAILVAGAAAATTTTTQPAKTAPQARPHRAAQPVTRADIQARIAKTFARLDTNHDGVVTEAELNALDTQREQNMEQRAEKFDPAKIFDRLDANHDGKVTVAEANAARNQRAQAKGGKPAQASATAFSGLFARADTNKDQVISRAEFTAMGDQIKGRMEHRATAVGNMATRFFANADSNKDKRVSLAEMQQNALAQFDKLDLNHDGTISPQERQQARQAFQASRKSK
jgi:Ca2+-binding EF-hand superfamily protein